METLGLPTVLPTNQCSVSFAKYAKPLPDTIPGDYNRKIHNNHRESCSIGRRLGLYCQKVTSRCLGQQDPSDNHLNQLCAALYHSTKRYQHGNHHVSEYNLLVRLHENTARSWVTMLPLHDNNYVLIRMV